MNVSLSDPDYCTCLSDLRHSSNISVKLKFHFRLNRQKRPFDKRIDTISVAIHKE